mgnify:CR=1 FL=1
MNITLMLSCSFALTDQNKKYKSNCTPPYLPVSRSGNSSALVVLDPQDLIGPSLYHQGRRILQAVTAWDMIRPPQRNVVIMVGCWRGYSTPALNALREEAKSYLQTHNRSLTFEAPRTPARASGVGHILHLGLMKMRKKSYEMDTVVFKEGFPLYLTRQSVMVKRRVVFINRNPDHFRHIINHESIIKSLEERNYEVVYISDMSNTSASEARAAIQSAQILISPHGQQMFNMLWAPQHAVCIELFWSHMYTKMYKLVLEQSGHRWGYVYPTNATARCRGRDRKMSSHSSSTRRCIRNYNFNVDVKQLHKEIVFQTTKTRAPA